VHLDVVSNIIYWIAPSKACNELLVHLTLKRGQRQSIGPWRTRASIHLWAIGCCYADRLRVASEEGLAIRSPRPYKEASQLFDRLPPRVLHVFHLQTITVSTAVCQSIGASERTQNKRKERKERVRTGVLIDETSLQSVRESVARTGQRGHRGC
jgi:hypothetical protein